MGDGTFESHMSGYTGPDSVTGTQGAAAPTTTPDGAVILMAGAVALGNLFLIQLAPGAEGDEVDGVQATLTGGTTNTYALADVEFTGDAGDTTFGPGGATVQALAGPTWAWLLADPENPDFVTSEVTALVFPTVAPSVVQATPVVVGATDILLSWAPHGVG